MPSACMPSDCGKHNYAQAAQACSCGHSILTLTSLRRLSAITCSCCFAFSAWLFHDRICVVAVASCSQDNHRSAHTNPHWWGKGLPVCLPV